MQIFIWMLALSASLTLLITAANIFTNASEKIGLYFGLSGFIVGATIVSIGGSLPELATSIIAVTSNDPQQLVFPIDNILGSNIANCLLVGGVCAITVKQLKVKKKLIDVDLPFFFMASALFFLFIMDGSFTAQEGFVSLLLLLVFVFYTLKSPDHESEETAPKKIEKIGWQPPFLIIGGILAIYFAASFTLTSVLKISDLLKINSTLVTMLFVAIGTSLPEFIISLQAAFKGKHSIAIGNIFGSNIFNVLAVSGIPALFGTLKVSEGALKFGIPFFVVSSLAFIFTTSDDKIQIWEGLALLVIYLAFIGKLLGVL